MTADPGDQIIDGMRLAPATDHLPELSPPAAGDFGKLTAIGITHDREPEQLFEPVPRFPVCAFGSDWLWPLIASPSARTAVRRRWFEVADLSALAILFLKGVGLSMVAALSK